jgi:hypothetical protein
LQLKDVNDWDENVLSEKKKELRSMNLFILPNIKNNTRNTNQKEQETEAYVANVNVVLCGKAKKKIQKYLQEFMKSFGIE